MNHRIKKALICKDITDFIIDDSLNNNYLPKAGDVALFRIKEVGKHTKIQNAEGKNRCLFPGDLVLCAFGNRYATNQIEGYVPTSIHEEYHMLGQGGVAGIVKTMYEPLEERGPTTLELIGYAVNEEGEVKNTKTPFLELVQKAKATGLKSKVILSLGTAMDSGKTTTAGYLCRGLSMAGKKVAYMKLTGTIYGKDPGFAYDCGATSVVDFSHFGYPSTYMCSEKELVVLFEALLGKLESRQPDYVVVEIADGLLQRETRTLLTSKKFIQKVDSAIFSAGDSLGVVSGLELLKKWGIRLFAVGGRFTMSPLLVEEVKENCGIDVLRLLDLGDKSIIEYFEPGLVPVREIPAYVA